METAETAAPTFLDAIVVESVVREYTAGRNPIVDFETAVLCLKALGRPLTLGVVRDLLVETHTLAGRSTAPLTAFVAAADAYIRRRQSRPNLKRQAAATARAAKAKAAGASA